MTKNPFEVRLDILKMAQEMLETEHRSKELKFKEEVETMRSSQQVPLEEIRDFIQENELKAYSVDDVVTRSTQLYSFVNSKS